METDPFTEELELMRAEILAQHGGDIGRAMEESMRRQYTLGRDLYGRSKSTGRIEIVFKGNSKDATAAAPIEMEAPR